MYLLAPNHGHSLRVYYRPAADQERVNQPESCTTLTRYLTTTNRPENAAYPVRMTMQQLAFPNPVNINPI
jgi:hypothetical protein